MSEKGQPLPYRLGACAGCCDLEQQLAQMTQEREQCVRDMSGWMDNGETLSQAICAMRLSASTFKQQLVQAQAARTICDVHQAEFDRLEEQLAAATQQLAQAEEEIACLNLQKEDR